MWWGGVWGVSLGHNAAWQSCMLGMCVVVCGVSGHFITSGG